MHALNFLCTSKCFWLCSWCPTPTTWWLVPLSSVFTRCTHWTKPWCQCCCSTWSLALKPCPLKSPFSCVCCRLELQPPTHTDSSFLLCPVLVLQSLLYKDPECPRSFVCPFSISSLETASDVTFFPHRNDLMPSFHFVFFLSPFYHLESFWSRDPCRPWWALMTVGLWSWMKRISCRGWGTLEQLCHCNTWQGGHPGQRQPLFHRTSGSQ